MLSSSGTGNPSADAPGSLRAVQEFHKRMYAPRARRAIVLYHRAGYGSMLLVFYPEGGWISKPGASAAPPRGTDARKIPTPKGFHRPNCSPNADPLQAVVGRPTPQLVMDAAR